jgi:hypothetical protein
VICSYFSGIGSLTAGTVGLGLLITLIVRPGHAEAGLDQPDGIAVASDRP